jgi:hypothetical protein
MSFKKTGIRIFLFILLVVIFIIIRNAHNSTENTIIESSVQLNGIIPRLNYVVQNYGNDNSPINYRNFSSLFNPSSYSDMTQFISKTSQQSQNTENTMSKFWSTILNQYVTDPNLTDQQITTNLNNGISALANMSLQKPYTTSTTMNFMQQYFNNQFENSVAKWIYTFSFIIVFGFIIYFLYKMIQTRTAIFQLANPLTILFYILEIIILFAVLVGYTFKKNEIIKTGSEQVGEVSYFESVFIGYLVTLFFLVLFVNIINILNPEGNYPVLNIIRKIFSDQTVMLYFVFILYFLIIAPFILILLATIVHFLYYGINWLIGEFSSLSNANAKESYWTFPFFELLVEMITPIDEDIDDNKNATIKNRNLF